MKDKVVEAVIAAFESRNGGTPRGPKAMTAREFVNKNIVPLLPYGRARWAVIKVVIGHPGLTPNEVDALTATCSPKRK